MEMKELLATNTPYETLYGLYHSGKLFQEFPEFQVIHFQDGLAKRHKDIVFHSIRVLEQVMELESEPDLILRTAALYHDLGKGTTRAFTEGVVSFTAHEVVGARQLKRLLPAYGYTKNETKAAEALVLNHMRSFNFDTDLWTDSAIRRLITDMRTPEQLARLFKLFKADVTTKHLERKRVIWAKVDILEARAQEVLEADIKKARRPALNGNEVMELFQLKPGPELGKLMKFLYTEKGLALGREEAVEFLRKLRK